jgi:hypothetical protein
MEILMDLNKDDDQQFELQDGLNIEVGSDPADELEFEVVDDTPPEDRNRKPLQKDALAEDDEAEQYSAGVKKRLGELRHQAHDERRAKDAAIRERDEALRLARTAYERSKALEKQLSHGELSYAQEVLSKADLALESAKEKHRRAYEAGDAEQMAEAVAEMAEAKQQALNAKRWSNEANYRAQNNAGQQEDSGVDSATSSHQQQQPVNQPDPRAQDWARKNAWFGSDAAMTSLAYGVHETLIHSGVDPVRDADRYYTAIDREMRRRYPEYEWGDEAAPPARAKKPAQVVAPVTRTPTGNKNKVTLTKTQVLMAEKLGLTVEQYARELIKLQGAQQ